MDKQIKKEYEGYLEDNLQCPNCLRIMPNKEHRRKYGCKLCVKPEEEIK